MDPLHSSGSASSATSSDSSSDSNSSVSSDSSLTSNTSSGQSWIDWYCNLPGHDYFCHVMEEFIEDDFNLTGLASAVPFYSEAISLILDMEIYDNMSDSGTPSGLDVKVIESSAELLYGLIHARYICSRPGLHAMLEKLENRHFGVCPRTFCYNFPLLPVGRYDQPGLDTVKVYCYNCMDIYNPSGSRYQRVDGAFFGSTFPHLLFQTFPDYYASLLSLLQPNDAIPSVNPSSTSSPVPSSSDFDTDAHTNIRPNSRLRLRPQRSGHSRSSSLTESTSLQQLYVPKIFGFRVHESSKAGPKATWLRWQPGDDIKSGKGQRESGRNMSHMSSTSSSSSPHSYPLSTSNLPNSSSSNTVVGHRSTSSVHSLQQSNPNLQQQHSSLANSGSPSGGKTNVGVGPGVNMTIPSSSSAFSLPGIGGLSMSMSSGQDLPRSNNSSSFNVNVGSMSLDEAGSAGAQTKMPWGTGNDDEVNLGSAMVGVQMSGDTKR